MPMTAKQMIKYLKRNGFQEVPGGGGSHRKFWNQVIGIQNAQQNGIRIGRPEVPCSKKFLKLAYLQSKNKITAAEAAERLHISLSTYYKLRTKYRKELEQWKKQEV